MRHTLKESILQVHNEDYVGLKVEANSAKTCPLFQAC